MKIWLSEFTCRRLEAHMSMKFPAILTDDRGFRLVELPAAIVEKAERKWPGELDTAINFAISQNQRKTARSAARRPDGDAA